MGEPDEEVRRGAAVYSKRVLGFYDLLVVYLSNTFVWRCHRNRIADLYDQHIGTRHLDVGRERAGISPTPACCPA